MLSIEFRIPAKAVARSSGCSHVRCTGDTEVMAVKYGRDGRCGRIRTASETLTGRRFAREVVRPVACTNRQKEHRAFGSAGRTTRAQDAGWRAEPPHALRRRSLLCSEVSELMWSST